MCLIPSPLRKYIVFIVAFVPGDHLSLQYLHLFHPFLIWVLVSFSSSLKGDGTYLLDLSVEYLFGLSIEYMFDPFGLVNDGLLNLFFVQLVLPHV
jgi:hypothetical protein